MGEKKEPTAREKAIAELDARTAADAKAEAAAKAERNARGKADAATRAIKNAYAGAVCTHTHHGQLLALARAKNTKDFDALVKRLSTPQE